MARGCGRPRAPSAGGGRKVGAEDPRKGGASTAEGRRPLLPSLNPQQHFIRRAPFTRAPPPQNLTIRGGKRLTVSFSRSSSTPEKPAAGMTLHVWNASSAPSRSMTNALKKRWSEAPTTWALPAGAQGQGGVRAGGGAVFRK